MLDYILFDGQTCLSVTGYLRQLGLEPETSVVEQGWLIALPEDLDDELDGKIEACYAQLLQAEETRMGVAISIRRG
jgi:hypothetical protein